MSMSSGLITSRPKILVVRAARACASWKVRKLILLCATPQMGDPAVGKSALTQMFHSNGQRFPKVYNMTCGVDFSAKAVKIPETEEAVELHIFDTAGQVCASRGGPPTFCALLPVARGLT